jgi:hypothetical protein
MNKINVRTSMVIILGLLVTLFYACSKDSYQTALTTSSGSGLDLRGGGDSTCTGPHDSLWLGGHHPHDSLWIGWHHQHDSLHLGGPFPHDSTWHANHPKDTTGIGGGHPGGGHPGGGGHGGPHHGH